MYLIYNTLTQEYDEVEYRKDAEEQLIATQEWLEERRACGHQARLYSLDKTVIIKEEVS